MIYRVGFEMESQLYDIHEVVGYIDSFFRNVLTMTYHLDVDVEFNGWWFNIFITENKQWLRFKLLGKTLPEIFTSIPYSKVEIHDGNYIEIEP